MGINEHINDSEADEQGTDIMDKEAENIWDGTGIETNHLIERVMLESDQVIDRILGGYISWHAQAWKPQ